MELAAALACYLQALCRYLLANADKQILNEDDYLVYTYNRFQACRFGLDGTLVHPRSHEQISLREDILTTLRHIQPHAEFLKSVDSIEHVYAIVNTGNDANYIRQECVKRGSLEGVVDALLQKFR